MKTQKCTVIILAGGVGRRFSSKGPKQFFFLNGKPMLYHSIKPFTEITKDIINNILVVTHKKYNKEAEAIIRRYFPNDKEIQLINGGKFRIHSYLNAIDKIKKDFPSVPIIIAHDVARPLITKDDILDLYKHFVKSKADSMLVVRPLPESLFIQDKENLACIPRDSFFLGQSPNFFRSEILKKINYSNSNKYSETLDILELIKKQQDIKIIGKTLSHQNIKVTYIDDISIVSTLLNERK